MKETKTKFEIALEKLQKAGAEVNSAYYMDGLDKKYSSAEEQEQEDINGRSMDEKWDEHVGQGLWALIKTAESIADDIRSAIEYEEDKLEDKKNA
jgi:hypothetical protein